jgi:tetratricopeptide (TPR) repeat protein
VALSPKPLPTHSAAAVPSATVGSNPSRGQIAAAFGALLALVILTYSNHFHNPFHFDDYHAIVLNPYIRDLHNVPLFFKDVRMVDSLPSNQTYRPLLAVSFAVDYWLGHGLEPLWFHVSTFLWYLAQLALMFFVFQWAFDAARRDPRNAWAALFATALYGLHPAMAETVNYIVQRADLYSTLAVLAGLTVYISAPGLRRFGLYLLPVAAGLLAKQPTSVFPAILFAWIWLFETEDFVVALKRSLPAFIVIGPLAYFVLKMNPATFSPGGVSAFNYRISQPAVLLSYFRRFFLPLDLSADTDRKPYTSLLDVNVIDGFIFILLICAAIFWCRKRRETRPIAFGLFWFLVACGPTSWVPLSEVENDHRLFFPFVGLAMSLCWAGALWLYSHPRPRAAVVGVSAFLLATAAWGAHQRNIVWHTDESLWFDVTQKSPTNGRGLMNYGLSEMSQGRYALALDCYTRALAFNPNYSVLEINLGVVNGALHNNAEAERHFLRAIQLAPSSAGAKWYYARWLDETGRVPEAIKNLRLAIDAQHDYIDARYLLMQIYARLGDRESLRAEAEEVLAMFPSDATAREWLAKDPTVAAAPTKAANQADKGDPNAEFYLNKSLVLYRAGKYAECIAAAREALAIKPNYAEAWNNVMAAYNCMSDWDNAIAAGEKAVSLDPSYQLAQNNLALAKAQKEKSGPSHH